MVALRLFALLLAVGYGLPAHASTFPYEGVGQAGPNNIIDSNAESCDNSPCNPNITPTCSLTGNGVWSGPGEGCYTTTGAKCSDDPSHICNVQIVPKGRCSFGSNAACLWPHGAGHCVGDTHVGCLTDAYIASGDTTTPGTSGMCTGTGSSSCDMTSDPYTGATTPATLTLCTCDNLLDAAGLPTTGPDDEKNTCGTTSAKAICSDGDPDRDIGGYGTALGVFLFFNAPVFDPSFSNMGPSMNGDQTATQSPPYPIENLAANKLLEPQRDPGTVNRAGTTTTPIHKVRTTDAREITSFNPALGVSKIVTFGDSYWSDWAFVSVGVTGTFNTHIVTFTCDPDFGWAPNVVVNHGAGAGTKYCSEVGRNSVGFQWRRDLTGAELAANPTCPPNCKKDFDITTVELQAFIDAGQQDPDAGAQLAIQSGEGRQAGAGDAIGVSVVTSQTWLTTNDMRCKMGGWGSGTLGRCLDGATACDIGAAGDTLCGGLPFQGGLCVPCNGPITGGNPLGLPIGYNTHGLAELDLVAGQRVGGIGGAFAPAPVVSAVAVPLFVVATTGYAASDFRDLVGSAETPDKGILDRDDMGSVDPTSAFATGIGTGGTFSPGTLPIGENCCTTILGGPAGGSPIVWAPAALGVPNPGRVFNRTFDRGPGPDGIPGCTGDNAQNNNGLSACNQRLGKGKTGATTDGFFATGKDDVKTPAPVGAPAVPGSSNRFGVRDAQVSTVAWFSAPPYNFKNPNPATANLVAAFTLKDLTVLAAFNADVLVKVDGTVCPIVGSGPVCATGDRDGDGVPDTTDNCPTVPNGLAQAGVLGVGNQTDTDLDGVGDACDNCVAVANPRVKVGTPPVDNGPEAYLATHQWATLTGGQRDDDHDGFGNKCDAKFVGLPTQTVGGLDLGQFRASNGHLKSGHDCGTTHLLSCAIFDLVENGTDTNTVGGLDLGRFRTLNGAVPGPKCPTCPVDCMAGTGGFCP